MSDFDFDLFIGVLYLVAVIFFILGLKRLGSPKTARSGNAVASIGMLIAVVATLVNRDIISFELIAAGRKWIEACSIGLRRAALGRIRHRGRCAGGVDCSSSARIAEFRR